MSAPKKPHEASHSNFIRAAIEADLASGKYAGRALGGQAGRRRRRTRARRRIPRRSARASRPSRTATCTSATPSRICLNFGLARDYGGVCHLRFDDTNPEKEEQEYVDSILDAVKWLGFGWELRAPHLYYATRLLRLHVPARPST